MWICRTTSCSRRITRPRSRNAEEVAMSIQPLRAHAVTPAPRESMRGSRKEFLPFAVPTLGEEEVAAVVDVLRSGWLTTGPRAEAFEAEFAAYIGCRHALAVQSGTPALPLALEAAGLGPK